MLEIPSRAGRLRQWFPNVESVRVPLVVMQSLYGRGYAGEFLRATWFCNYSRPWAAKIKINTVLKKVKKLSLLSFRRVKSRRINQISITDKQLFTAKLVSSYLC